MARFDPKSGIADVIVPKCVLKYNALMVAALLLFE